MAKIVFIGDVFCEKTSTLREWPRELHADCCVLNFEGVYDNGKLTGGDAAENKTNLKGAGHPFLPGFKRYVATLANNHVLDFGQAGCEATLQLLKKCLVMSVGLTGPAMDRQFVELQDGVTLQAYMYPKLKYMSVPGCSYSVNTIDEATILADAARAREAGARFHVVSLHWGTELLAKPWPNQVALAHKLIDSGLVDLIVGMHPHCLQPIEVYRGKYVFYSIGNAVFPNFRQSSMFVDGRSTVTYACSWGRESHVTIVPTIDTDDFRIRISYWRYSNRGELYRISEEEAKVPLGSCIGYKDSWEAVGRRFRTGLRLLCNGEFPTALFHLKAAVRSRRSYAAALSRGM